MTPRKIELTLKKATPGVKWKNWGREILDVSEDSPASKPFPTQQSSNEGTPAEKAPISTLAGTPNKPACPPSYPSSSRFGAKNWEKMDLDDEEDMEKQDVDSFFKTIYKNASPEQQRAMLKSYTESNGTSLSTDWDDVKNRTVETQAPAGVQARKWDESMSG